MIKLKGHTLTPGERITPESNALTMAERASITRITLGPEQPELNVDDWVQEKTEPGAGIVWRVKAVETTFNTRTRIVTLEHAINTLRDVSMFGEVTAAVMGGGEECTARQAALYVLGQQNIWALGDFEFSSSAAFKFNGADLFSALQTISSTLDNPWWDYDMSTLPFKLHIRKKANTPICEMRMGRNLSTLRKTVDRSQMYTRIYPIGENDLHISGDYLSKNENIYGRKDKVLTDTGQDNETMLRIWAQDMLDRHCEPTVTITISGLELSQATGESLDHLVLGRLCRVPLPEFGTTITERITKLNWKDAANEPENVTVTLCNTLQDIASIINKAISEGAGSSGAASRAKAKKDAEDHAWFFDTESHVGMVAEAIIGQGPDGVNWSRVAEIIVDGEGIHQQVVLAQGSIITMQGRQDMTEESLTTVFEKTGIGSLDAGTTLYGMQVMSAESLYTVFQKTGIGSLGAGETLYGMQRMSAESLVTVFQKTGINSLGQNETLYGLQHMSAESLTTIFRKTGVDSLGNNETLYSRQVMNTESLTTVFQKTGINNLGNNETLYSRQVMNAESLTTVYQKTGINSLGQNETLYSKVTQTAESLTSKVGKGEIASTINQTTQSVLISASKINLEGYVTATELNAEKARFDNLTSGMTHAMALTAGTLQANTILNVAGTNFLPRTIKIGSIISATVLSSSRADIELDHYHNVSIAENNGTVTVTIGNARLSQGSANFNIADTTFHRNAVSAARAHSISALTLTSSDTGTSSKTVTVYSLDDEETDLTISVNAAAVYAAGVTNGKNAVTIDRGTWENGVLWFTKSEGTASSKKVDIRYGSVTWNGTSGTIPVYDYGTGTNVSIDYDVSVSGAVPYAAGQNSVTISNSDIVRDGNDYYNSSTHNTTVYVEATASNGAQGTQSFTVSGANAYNAGQNSVTISNSDIVRDGEDYYNTSTHNTTVYVEATASNGAQGTQSFTVSGANAYNAGYSAGYSAGSGAATHSPYLKIWDYNNQVWVTLSDNCDYTLENTSWRTIKWGCGNTEKQGILRVNYTGTATFAYRFSNIGTQFQVHLNGQSSGLYGVLEYDDGYVYMRDANTGYDYARVYVANLV